MFGDHCPGTWRSGLQTGCIIPFFALALAGCGGSAPVPQPPPAGREGDAALISSTQAVSDAVGGCVRPAESTVESKVVSLESGTIVMLACGQDSYSYTYRLFALQGGQAPELLALPDYDGAGWFANTQASMAEIDAGTGVLTTYRKGAEHGGCGSEGRFVWDGERFLLQELRWQGCNAPNLSNPPFPIVWPVPQGSPVDQSGATPEP